MVIGIPNINDPSLAFELSTLDCIGSRLHSPTLTLIRIRLKIPFSLNVKKGRRLKNEYCNSEVKFARTGVVDVLSMALYV